MAGSAGTRKTVAVKTIQTRKLGAANGKAFNLAFRKSAERAIRREAKLELSVSGKYEYAIAGSITKFTHTGDEVTVGIGCHLEQKVGKVDKLTKLKTTSSATISGVSTRPKDVQSALKDLANVFAPDIVKKFARNIHRA